MLNADCKPGLTWWNVFIRQVVVCGMWNVTIRQVVLCGM